jgi:hypothetical protein
MGSSGTPFTSSPLFLDAAFLFCIVALAWAWNNIIED